MFQKFLIMLAGLILGLLTLSACNGSEVVVSEPTNPPVSEPTDVSVIATPAPTNTPIPEPTDAPESAASTPTNTLIPEPTDAPQVEEVVGTSDAAATEEPAEEVEAAAGAVDEVRIFTLVPAGSRASYIVAEEFFGGALNQLGISPGLVDTVGSTQEIEGELQLNFNDPSPLVSANFIVNIQSLTSDQQRRDNRIRTRDLESNRYPLAEFTATGLEDVPQEYAESEEVTFRVNGEMTIRDITNPVTFDVRAKLEGDTITGVATTALAMTDFGFNPPNIANLFSVENEFTVEVQFTLKEQN